MSSSTPTPLRMSGMDWTLLVLLAVIWGGAFFLVAIILRDLDPLTLVAGRVVIAAVTLWVLALVWRLPMPRTWPVWRAFLVLGVLNNAVPFSLLAFGQTQIGAGLAAILNATTPLFTALVATLALADERLTPAKTLGIALGFLGVVVMVGPNALAGLFDSVAGQIACVGAAFSYGLAAVYARRFKALGLAPRQIATGQLTASALVMSGIALLFAQPHALLTISATGLASLAAMGVVCTALAYLIYFRLVANAGATNASLVTFLVPATAILLGVLVLGERLTGPEIAGMALILAGLACIDGRLLSRAQVLHRLVER
ncbi:MAG: DMT family transporter [Pseudomonadota bacterium]